MMVHFTDVIHLSIRQDSVTKTKHWLRLTVDLSTYEFHAWSHAFNDEIFFIHIKSRKKQNESRSEMRLRPDYEGALCVDGVPYDVF